ncbi:zinc finger CW-type PWWP domain protein 1-like [Leguminivora glycinivorella]|uniref:zinc finger CW-type PWWP domain protein 1-like n=1 Tax=Leguminivora glycinivorella TaxID=1035111 RepID=UPI00200EF1CA|nr:zinc finger CW-type PWWP domain protein 1-like [Leguminivora glycinivorella]
MENAELPIENAHEPTEEAHQPVCSTGSTMSPKEEANKPKKKHATFQDNTMTEKELSQTSSSYREALSQPAPGLSHRQRLAWLQKRRGPGLWVQCDACNSWRHLSHVVDSHQLPRKWYCTMNPDKALADCSAPEAPLRISDEEDLIHSEYSAGSLVWARLPGWPWWPAMVDDEPDTEQFYWLDGFSDIPTHYNVVFFDERGPTRAWISPENLEPYTQNKKRFRRSSNYNQYKKRLERSIHQANKAETLPVADRLAKFSFINTYKGPIMSPKKVTKTELAMFQKKLKRKFNVDFPIEASSDSEDEESIQALREINKKKNVILIGTPRSKKAKQDSNPNNDSDTTVTETVLELTVQENRRNGNLKENNEDQSNKEDRKRKPSTEQEVEKKPKKIIEFKTPKKGLDVVKNTTNISFASATTINSQEQSFKIPDSMATEIGSTPTLNLGSQINGFDNDSSKTYAPGDESDSAVITQDFQIRIETPSSDDFDF